MAAVSFHPRAGGKSVRKSIVENFRSALWGDGNFRLSEKLRDRKVENLRNFYVSSYNR